MTGLAFSFFLSYNIFSFSPGRWFEIFLSLVPGVFFSFFLVPWMLVDIRLVNIYIYIYIYIYIIKAWRQHGWHRFSFVIRSNESSLVFSLLDGFQCLHRADESKLLLRRILVLYMCVSMRVRTCVCVCGTARALRIFECLGEFW